MTEPEWLLKPVILAVHAMTISEFGGAADLRDEDLLDAVRIGIPLKKNRSPAPYAGR